MRQIGNVPHESQAQTIVDSLLTQGVEGHFEREGETFEIWIRDEDHLEKARQMLAEFHRDPNQPAFMGAGQAAQAIRRDQQRRLKEVAKNQVQISKTWSQSGPSQQKPVTKALLVISIVVFIATGYGSMQSSPDGKLTFSQQVLFTLTFLDLPAVETSLRELPQQDAPSSFPNRLLKKAAADSLEFNRKLEDQPVYRMWSLLHGQLWRFFTPCVIHFGLMHIVFNLWMLFSLGGMLEARVGSIRYLIFILVSGVVSNTVQGLMPEALDGSLLFGGMSGVIFGLFGWTLIRQQFGRAEGMYLSPFSIVLLIGWLVAGFLHALPGLRMANWCHGIGFLVGLIAGYLPVLFKRK